MSSKESGVYDALHETALKAPSSSGVYLWRDAKHTVIYVGKAKCLRNRLRSYFAGNQTIKTRTLVSRAASIEYITTSNEYEAFLLENNLIKQYNPRYNIDLKDGKSYPSLRLTRDKFPRLFKTRNIVHDGSRYFGPYPDASALDAFLQALFRLYPLRHCKTLRTRTSPCLYHHIGRCSAPCCGKITQESYNEYIGEITALLEDNNIGNGEKGAGNGEDGIGRIEEEMKRAAKELNFEKAARLRDGIKALKIMKAQNVVESFDSDDRDYIDCCRAGELLSVTVLRIRSGKLTSPATYRAISLADDDELLSEFLNAYYTDKTLVPPVVYIPAGDRGQGTGDDDGGVHLSASDLTKWLCDTLGANTRVITVARTQEGVHAASINMTRQNAREDIIRRRRERGDKAAMQELKNLLGLSALPSSIEGFDIAHIEGKFPVASLITFKDGQADKSNYRYFRLKTTDGIIDDFASMREAASRRYTRLINEDKTLPDLILIDGGIGQVNAVWGVLDALGLDIPIAGLAKRDEEVWLPHAKEPIRLPRRSDALRLLQRVRDETHRFATSKNQQLRTKENTKSPFLAIPSIGEKRALLLEKKYITLTAFAAADAKEAAQVLRISEEKAQKMIETVRTM